jgi:antitoxin CptB
MDEAQVPVADVPPARHANRCGDAGRAIDERALSKLRWRCRRGLLENDLLLERFFSRAEPVSEAEAEGLGLLMELADNELLDIFLGRQKPPANLDRPEVRQVIEAVRVPR